MAMRFDGHLNHGTQPGQLVGDTLKQEGVEQNAYVAERMVSWPTLLSGCLCCRVDGTPELH